MADLVEETETMLAPFVEAFVVQEGSWWFGKGQDDEHGTSQWAAKAQRYMAAPLPDGWTWAEGASSTNEFHLLSDEGKIPPYYRHKHRADVEIVSVAEKTLRSSTVAQLRYVQVSVKESGIGLNGFAIIKEEKAHVLFEGGFLHNNDVGREYVSAIEIGTKMASRQLIFNKTIAAVNGGGMAPDSLYNGSRCAEINQKAYEWALEKASPEARQRHIKYGIPMKMADDVKPFPPAGPWWIWNYLQYNTSPRPNPVLNVQSWYAFYSTSGLAYGAGNHYCKALSPARALEWIYTDSLK
jgi:hypothetical protein